MFKRLRKKYNISNLEWSWIQYDIANSAFVLTVVTVLFPILNAYVADEAGISMGVRSSTYSFLVAGLSLFVALISPFLGSLANYAGRKAKFFKFFVYFGCIFGVILCIPYLSWVPLMLVYALSYIGYQGSNVFYDSFLIDVSPDEERSDQISSYGFSFGYIGSMIPFAIGIIPFALQYTGIYHFENLFGCSEYMAMRIVYSFAFIVNVVWWWVFSKPMFRDVKQTYNLPEPERPIKEAWVNLVETARDVASYKNIFVFLISYVLYMDVTSGLIKTVNNITQDMGINAMHMLAVIVIIQLVAFPCAIIYGLLAKKYGPKKMLYVGMVIYGIVVICATFVNADRIWLIYLLGLLVGTAQGGIQAVSRSYFARLVPREKANEFFGFYGIFSKFTGIISPFLYGLIIRTTENPNLAMSGFFIPLILGAIIFNFVKTEKAVVPKTKER